MTVNSRIIRLPEVKNLTGISRSQIYELIKKGKFPKQINLEALSEVFYLSSLAPLVIDLQETPLV